MDSLSRSEYFTPICNYEYSKWRRLIHAIGSVDLPVSFWTFLGDVTEYKMPTPSADQISTCDGGRGIGDHNACGPFFFRDVERVRWPAKYSRHWFRDLPPTDELQPLTELSVAIDSCGVFDYDFNEDGLVLFAYRDTE